MAWNLEKINNKIIELETQISELKDFQNQEILYHDLYILKMMVSYKTGSKSPDDYAGFSYDKTYYKKITNLLIDNIPLLTNKLYEYSIGYRIPLKCSFKNKIDMVTAESLIRNFLAFYDDNLANLYEELSKNQKLEIGARINCQDTCLGRCYYIMSDKSPYLSVKKIKNINDVSILIHELGHAYQYLKLYDETRMLNYTSSFFSEAYSIFLSLVFIEYLKNTKYAKQAHALQGDEIDNFLCLLEYKLFDLYKFDTDVNANQDSATSLLSNVLAYYWYSIYLQNPDQAKTTIQEFDSCIGTEKELDYMKTLFLSDLDKSIKLVLNNYIKRE